MGIVDASGDEMIPAKTMAELGVATDVAAEQLRRANELFEMVWPTTAVDPDSVIAIAQVIATNYLARAMEQGGDATGLRPTV